MMSSRSLIKETLRLSGIVILALLLTLIVPGFWFWLSLLLLTYIFWHLRQLSRLWTWVKQGKAPPPHAIGIWGEFFDELYRYQSKNQAVHKRLKRILEKFEDTATAMPDATVILDKSDSIEWCNDAAERLLGLKRNKDYGQNIGNLLRHPTFVHYLEGNSNEEIVEIPSPRDDNIFLRIRLVVYGNQQRLLLARNVTRLHKLEEIRRDFIANVSHELRTPLTIISGFIENIQDSPSECKNEWQRPLDLMQGQSNRMLSIINDLLFLSQLETGTTSNRKMKINVPELLAKIKEESLSLGNRKQHSIHLEVDDSLRLKGDYNELYSAISNLTSNAVKYTPEHGNITIRWLLKHKEARLEVEDDGIGIPTQHLSRLTERFYRVDVGRSREQGGTGLGLAIVKHVLIRHNARLEIFSTADKGSCFVCTFPASYVVINQSG